MTKFRIKALDQKDYVSSTQISLRLPDKLLNAFQDLCDEIGVTRSDAIRQMIQNAINTQGN